MKNNKMSLTEDHIENMIGRFGRYQTWILILISIGRIPTEIQLSNVVFLIPSVKYVCLDEGALNVTNFCPCKYPQYDQSNIVTSVTSTWNLICNRQHLAGLAQSMLQVGILAGSIFYGYVSDRYGRKIAVLASISSAVAFVALSAAVPEFWMFMVFRFLIGTSVGGTMLCCYIIIIEISGKSFRPYMTGLIEIVFVISYASLPLIAYFLREWRHLQLATSLPWVFVIFYYWLIPESPRWLITTGKRQEAINLLTYIAKKNKLPTENIESLVIKIEEQTFNEKSTYRYGSYLDLFRTSKVRTSAIIMALVWMCCSHTFFGVNQYIGRLQGDIYLNVFLSSITLLPGLIMVVLATLYLKRKKSVLISFSVAAISLQIFIVIPSNIESATLAFAIIGQLGAYISFVLIYLYSSELFPTMIRNSAMGFLSVFARFGGFIAPFVVNIGVEWASISIFSSLAFFAAFLCLFLPETKDTVLLNTVAQTENPKIVNVEEAR